MHKYTVPLIFKLLHNDMQKCKNERRQTCKRQSRAELRVGKKCPTFWKSGSMWRQQAGSLQVSVRGRCPGEAQPGCSVYWAAAPGRMRGNEVRLLRELLTPDLRFPVQAGRQVSFHLHPRGPEVCVVAHGHQIRVCKAEGQLSYRAADKHEGTSVQEAVGPWH